MNQSDAASRLQIARWAARQLADYDARQPGSIFAEGAVLNVAEGYEVQATVAELRSSRGERIVGYKVGCTSPKIRAQLGIDHCVSGRLFDSERHSTGAVIARSNYANLAIEGELAVELSREPTDSDFHQMDIPACVARVIPVIELHHLVMRGAIPSAGELIAHNALHAGFVLGSGACPNQSFGEASLSILVDGRLMDACDGTSLLSTLRSSLQWLAAALRSRGERLAAGQMVLTGSIPSLIPIRSNCRVRVSAPPFGDVEAAIVD